VPTARESSPYWDGIAAGEDRLPPQWRRRGRDEHLDLIRDWVGDPTGRWLKTDLFEERSPDRALLPHLRSATWFAADVSPEVVRRAGAVEAANLAADVRALPYRGGAFDGVLSTSTLDHFADPADLGRSLRELRRVLRDGGTFVLTLDNAANPLIRARNALPHALARRTGLVPFSVGHTVALEEGETLLRDASFTVEHSAHLLHVPHVIGTRLARFGWYERNVLPRFAALAGTRAARFTGHFVAFLAVAR
jgi:SAM-dependent methyltransferase